MKGDLGLAVQYCEQNKETSLALLLKNTSLVKSVVEQYKFKTICRTNVPLLSIAIGSKSLDCVKLLIKNGADIESPDGSGSRPIHWACLVGADQCLALLIQNGADPNPNQNPSVTIPLIIAAKNGFTSCLQILLQSRVAVDQQDGAGRAALHHASWFNHSDSVQLLLTMGAKIDLTDSAGHTALHLASWFGHVETCKVLIECRAPLDVKDNAGRTPLHFACQHNRPAIVSLLIEAGADVSIADCNGKTPEQIAAQEDRVGILEYLQNAAKDTNKSDSTSGHPPEVEFVEEHNKMKTTISKLLELRDEQFDQVNALQNRIEKQSATLSSLEMNQNQMKMKLEAMQSLLQAALKALTDLRLNNNNSNASSIHFTMSRTPTNPQMQSQMSMQPQQQQPVNRSIVQSQLGMPANPQPAQTPKASQPATIPVNMKSNFSTLPTMPQVQGSPMSSMMNSPNLQSSPLLNTSTPSRTQSPPIGSVDIFATTGIRQKPNDLLCNICHKNMATEKCRTCGNQICEQCLEEVKHVCPICHPKVVK